MATEGNRHQRFCRRAAELAAQSPMLMQHGCVITHGGKIVAEGYNHFRPHLTLPSHVLRDLDSTCRATLKQSYKTTCSCHAEMDAVHRLLWNKRTCKLSPLCDLRRTHCTESIMAWFRAVPGLWSESEFIWVSKNYLFYKRGIGSSCPASWQDVVPACNNKSPQRTNATTLNSWVLEFLSSWYRNFLRFIRFIRVFNCQARNQTIENTDIHDLVGSRFRG